MYRRVLSVTLALHIVAGVACLLTGVAPAWAQAANAAVPASLVRAFQQAYPGATITATAHEREANRSLFRIEGVNKGRRQIVVYEANGGVIETAEQVDEKDLPGPVASAMHSHPKAIYVTGLKVTRGRSARYELTLRGTRKTAMVVQPDGTVISFR
jgi:hypothetical protein